MRFVLKALEINEDIKISMKKIKLPENVTVNAVLDAVSDNLMPERISFFKYIMVERFLRLFQRDKLLAEFMYQELKKINIPYMEKFIKRDILDAKKSPIKPDLSRINAIKRKSKLV